MSRQHSIIPHRANYFYRILEDDYLLVYETLAEGLDPIKDQEGKKLSGPSDCKAMIASVLENWMNSKRLTAKCEEDLYVYLTYDEWESELRHRYGRSKIMQCLDEMEKEGCYVDTEGTYGERGTVYTGTIKKRHFVQNTFEYQLNLPVVISLLEDLPEQSPFEQKARPSLGRPKKYRPEKNDIKVNDIDKNGLNVADGSVKVNDQSIEVNAPFYTHITHTEHIHEESTGEQSDTPPIASSLSFDADLPDFPLITYADCITYLKLRGAPPQGDAVQVMVQARMLYVSDHPHSEIENDSHLPQEGDIAHATTLSNCPPVVAADQPRVPGEAVVAAESRTALDRAAPHRVQPAPEYTVSTDGEVLDVYLPPGSTDRIPSLPSADMGDLSLPSQDLRSLPPASRMALEAAQEEIDDSEATVPPLAAVTPSEQSSPSAAVELGQGTGSPLPAAPATQHGTNAQERSHVQDRDTLPRPVAVTRDSGSSPRPTPLADPGVSPPQSEIHVLVVAQQFASLDEWKRGQGAFMKMLSDTWKIASADFKQQYGNWNGYRKHYLDRWLKVNPKPAEELPIEVQRLLDDWKSLHRKVIPITRSDIDAAVMLAPCAPTREELSACRKWHFATDDPKKPWYRKIGVSLMDVAKNWSKWQSLQEPEEKPEKPVARTLTREELRRIPV